MKVWIVFLLAILIGIGIFFIPNPYYENRVRIWEEAKQECLTQNPKYWCDLQLGATFQQSPESF